MLRTSFIALLIWANLAITEGQTVYTFSVGSSATSRIPFFPDNNFTKNEIAEFKDLESTNLSFEVNMGVVWELNQKINLHCGIGYKKNRFGSRIYNLPAFYPNGTPQYGRIKQVPEFDQEYLFGEMIFCHRIISPIFRVSFIYNSREKLYEAAYDGNNEKGLTGHLIRLNRHENPTINRFDVNIRSGFNYEIFKNNKSRLLIKPFMSIYLRPYKTLGEHFYYLYFNKDTIGYVWDIGLNVQYNFGKYASSN